MDQSAPEEMPASARLLGYAGLLPALASLLAVLFGNAEMRAVGFQTGAIYAALILSFLGGSWWGLALRVDDREEQSAIFAWGVVPCLIAWSCLYYLTSGGMLLLGALFLAALRMDVRLDQLGLTPAWWLQLRTPLSIGMAAMISMMGLVSWVRELG